MPNSSSAPGHLAGVAEQTDAPPPAHSPVRLCQLNHSWSVRLTGTVMLTPFSSNTVVLLSKIRMHLCVNTPI